MKKSENLLRMKKIMTMNKSEFSLKIIKKNIDNETIRKFIENEENHRQ